MTHYRAIEDNPWCGSWLISYHLAFSSRKAGLFLFLQRANFRPPIFSLQVFVLAVPFDLRFHGRQFSKGIFCSMYFIRETLAALCQTIISRIFVLQMTLEWKDSVSLWGTKPGFLPSHYETCGFSQLRIALQRLKPLNLHVPPTLICSCYGSFGLDPWRSNMLICK